MSDIADLRAFSQAFPDDGACVEYLFNLRWPDGFSCPKCGAPATGLVSDRALVRCKNGHQISVTAGTAFHRSKQPLWNWFYAIYRVALGTTSISAVQLQKDLGLKNYEPAFQLLHKLRSALVAPDRDRLHGEVEVDEMYVGGPEEGHPGRGAVDKVLVVTAVEAIRWTNEKGQPRVRAGRVRMSAIPNAQAATLVPWVQKNIEEGSHLVTDGHAGYNPLTKLGYSIEKHISTKGDHLYLTGLIIANFKARMQGTYHGAVLPKHLQAYLNEYVFRFNRRFWRASAFDRALTRMLAETPLEYDELYSVGKPDGYVHPNPKVRR